MSEPIGGRPPSSPVVVTAASVLSPIGDDLATFAAALLAGRSGVVLDDGADQSAPAATLDGFEVRQWAARHLADDPATAEQLCRLASRLPLPARTAACVALVAVRDAGLPTVTEPAVAARTGIVGAGSNLALAHSAEAVLAHAGHAGHGGRLRASYALTHLDNDVIGTVAEVTGITGEGWTVGAASASGTVALVQAVRAIASGALDHVLVVAPAVRLSAAAREAFRLSGAMAWEHFRDRPGSMCRPFDTRRQGFVAGEGAAALVLETAAAAQSRGASALAVIAGHGQRLDARRGTAPDADGEVAAMRAAIATAGLTPAEIDYVNAHGTGSELGDATEARALRRVFDGATPMINSTKPLTGHCLGAAGLVEAVACIAQLRAGACHPNPNLDAPLDDQLHFVGREAVHRPLRTALSTSVGFGGVNAAVVLRAATTGKSR